MLRISIVCLLALAVSCTPKTASEEVAPRKPVRLITVDPGHFHAALIQKVMYPEVDSTVHVYAPEGPDLKMHLDRVNSYNTRPENPTHWNEQLFAGEHFFERMIQEKPGNVVVLSGNNQKKTEYILKSLEAGLNVYADKPMVIDAKGFDQLKKSFEVAAKNKLLLYDIMTERFEITTMLQRELSMIPEIFGELEKGTTGNPAITKESIHHFYKYVSGSVLTRPAWFLDAEQQGEGIVDVMTHLVDLVQWEAFPNQALDYTKDITITKARRWTTDIPLSKFKTITKLDGFPEYLKKNVTDTVLKVSSNGEVNYQLRGVNAKTSVIWNYESKDGSGDTHYSIMRGTKANLVISQGPKEQYKVTLYINPVKKDKTYDQALADKFKALQEKYPGIELVKTGEGWTVTIPDSYKEGHEAHFGRVTERFIEYLTKGTIPEWEVPNMLAKYYTTTQALEASKK
ncbi:MAG TPA: putative oxidoreductase C-terminal domain-containing protein [Cyclobacteriaceae bacterium]|nr:putative oxidoreductase C-terminal domain-containing protein [Cyclobacteriaceae bacterium]